MIYGVFPYLVTLAGAALILVAQRFVAERSSGAAARLSIAGGLVAGYEFAQRFASFEGLFSLSPLVWIGAAGTAAWGLLILVDELNPVRAATLPPALSGRRNVSQGVPVGPRLLVGFLALGAIAMSIRAAPPFLLMAAAGAVVTTIAGSLWLARRGNPGIWVIERRPELVVWIYPSKTTVVRRGFGTLGVYWSAMVGLSTGTRASVPAGGESAAASLVTDIAQVCPRATVGYSGELDAKFRMSPDALRRAP
jgi:hypothetical protein